MALSARSSSRLRARKPELGIAMVGHAFMGRAHSNAMRQAGRFFDLPFEIVPRVVVGRDAERAADAAEQFGFRDSSTDLDQVLTREDVHVVDVATPNDSHHEITIRALTAGKHVLCEKPLAMTIDQAEEMAALARDRGLRTGLWHNYRRCPATTLAAKMIARGDIGDVRQVRATYLQDWLSNPDTPASWRTDRDRCGSGAHGDLNAHLIDLIRALTGLEFSGVCGIERTFTERRKDDRGVDSPVTVDDAFCFLARFSNGAIGTFEATRTAPGRKNHNRIEINGSHGTICWNLERMNELEFFSDRDGEDVRGFRTILCMDDPHPYAAHWWPDGHLIGYEHTFTHHLVDWVLALERGVPFHPDFDDGIVVQRVLEAAMASARSGTWHEV